MSPEGELASLARHYGWVSADGRSANLDEYGLDLALSARTQTLALGSRVLRSAGLADHTGLNPSQSPRRVLTTRAQARTVMRALERHPVATFAVLLERYARPDLPHSPSDYAVRRPRNQVETAWHRIHALAISAYDLWQQQAGAMSPEQEWDGVLDVTAIARTLVRVDRDLCTATHLAQVRMDVRRALYQAERSWLPIAADAVDRIALQPDPRTPLQHQPTISPHLPVRVRSAATLLEGQRRLVTFIASEPQSPARIALAARAHRGIITRYAQHLSTPPPWTTQAAHALMGLPLHDGELTAVAPTSAPATIAQLREIQRYLLRAPRAELTSVATDGLAAASAALCTLADVTDKEVRGISWAISHGDAIDTNPRLRWQPVRTPRVTPPRLSTILRTVCDIVGPAAQLPPPPAPPQIERAASILTGHDTHLTRPADLPVHARGQRSLAQVTKLRERPEVARPIHLGDPPLPWPTRLGASPLQPPAGLGLDL